MFPPKCWRSTTPASRNECTNVCCGTLGNFRLFRQTISRQIVRTTDECHVKGSQSFVVGEQLGYIRQQIDCSTAAIYFCDGVFAALRMPARLLSRFMLPLDRARPHDGQRRGRSLYQWVLEFTRRAYAFSPSDSGGSMRLSSDVSLSTAILARTTSNQCPTKHTGGY